MFLHIADILAKKVRVPTTGLHADFWAIKTQSPLKHDWRCSRQESGPTKTLSISGQLVRTRRSMFQRTGIRPASTCHNKLPRGKVLPFGRLALTWWWFSSSDIAMQNSFEIPLKKPTFTSRSGIVKSNQVQNDGYYFKFSQVASWGLQGRSLSWGRVNIFP